MKRIFFMTLFVALTTITYSQTDVFTTDYYSIFYR